MTPRLKSTSSGISARRVWCLSVCLLLAGCASAGGEDPFRPRTFGVPAPPLSWPTGQYVLEATIRYPQDSRHAEYTAIERHSAELTIAPNGTMSLSSPFGSCRDPRPDAAMDRARGTRSFDCGTATYHLRPGRGTVIGELVATVLEERRVRGRCIQYDGGECSEFSWDIQSRQTDKRARLTVSDP